MRPRLLAMTLGLGLGVAMAQAAMAVPLDTAGASQCATRGYSIDPDPGGTRLRSAPRADAPVIGRLAPRALLGPDMHEGVEFDIVGSKDGWLLIRPGEGDFTLDPANAADGRGWVPGRLVGTALSRPPFRAAPRRDAPVLVEMQGPQWGPDSALVSAVHACQGKYVEVTATPYGGKPVRGWSWEPCSNQKTTCDGGGTTE
jgi:hypothetical protein